jgi:hypothetical protein
MQSERDTQRVNDSGATGRVSHLASVFQETGISPFSTPAFFEHHPFDPLSGDEIRAASAVCKAYARNQGIQTVRFNTVTLKVVFGCLACMQELAARTRRWLAARLTGCTRSCLRQLSFAEQELIWPGRAASESALGRQGSDIQSNTPFWSACALKRTLIHRSRPRKRC